MAYEQLLEELTQQEQDLQFTSFTNEDAVTLGMAFYEKAKSEKLAIAIDVTRNGQQLFHAALPGTSPDQDQWLLRKARIVNRFNMSSYRMGIYLKSCNASLEEKYNLSTADYAPHGGAFPIIIKNVGVVGSIAVSGLPQAEDHALVVNGILAFLKDAVNPL